MAYESHFFPEGPADKEDAHCGRYVMAGWANKVEGANEEDEVKRKEPKKE